MIEVTNETQLDYKEYIPKGAPVRRVLCENDCVVKTSWGENLHAVAGQHYILTNVNDDNDTWPVERDIFEATYSELEDGTWKKSAVVLAAKMDYRGICKTLEGDVSFEEGFYICKGAKGEVWPLTAETFEKKYESKTTGE